MNSGFKNRKEVAEALADEELGYFFTSYCSAADMPNESSRRV